ncbi:MAG TPA: hypothetical protein VFJ91_05055 [Gaiellaceae bacterium]|nr:hypothetical protein [Gaiellaceae bacterium]
MRREVSWKAFVYGGGLAGGTSIYGTLSTGSSSESDGDLTATTIFASNPGGSTVGARKPITVTSKTSYYLNVKTDFNGATSVGFHGDQAHTVIWATCAYL